MAPLVRCGTSPYTIGNSVVQRPGQALSLRRAGPADPFRLVNVAQRGPVVPTGKNRSESASRQAASSRQLLCTVIALDAPDQRQHTMRRASRGGQPWHTSRAI